MARSKQGFFLVGTLNGGPPSIQHVGLKVSTAYYKGQPLRISATTGSAIRLAAAGTVVYGVLTSDVALADASVGKYPVWLADSNNVFEGRAGATSCAKTIYMDLMDVVVGTIHNYRIARGTTTTKVLRIVGTKDTDGTVSGASAATMVRHRFIFNPDKSLFNAGQVNNN